MDFSLTTEQVQFQDALDKALATVSPLSRIRAHVDAVATFPGDIWECLAKLGLPGIVVPERFGGLGLGVLDAALIAEILGKHATPGPFLGANVLAPLAVGGCDSEEVKTEILPRIASGELRIGVGISAHAAGRRSAAGVTLRDGRLDGCALFVLDETGAHQFLVAGEDRNLFLVHRDAPGLSVASLETVDRTRSTAKLVFNRVPAECLISPGDGLRRITDAARVVLAADMLGAAWKMLDQAVEYAKVREQFGRPIGTFQAVKHMCAEMAAELEPARALIWYAAYALDQQLPDASLSCVQAKAYVAEAARFVARAATEVHGGMGITDELGLHFWLKRISWGYQTLGSPARLFEEAARLLQLA